MSTRQPLLAPLLLAFFSFFATPGWAIETGIDNLRLSGFATLGVTQAGSKELGFRRDMYYDPVFDRKLSVGADSLLGVQLDARINDSFGAAIQLVGKDRLNDSLESSVGWAYLSYQINPGWRLRLGRVGLDIYLLSDYRRLGFSYLWVRPPIEFYSPMPFDNLNGADLTWEMSAGSGLLRTKFFAGEMRNHFSIDDQVAALKMKDTYGFSLIWESDIWTVRAAMTRAGLDTSTGYFPGFENLAGSLLMFSEALEQLSMALPQPVQWPAIDTTLDEIAGRGGHFTYYSVGLAYNNYSWQIQGELGRVESPFKVYPTTDNAYLSVGHNFGAVTPYMVIARTKGDEGQKAVEFPPEIPDLVPDADEFNGAMQMMHAGIKRMHDSFNMKQRTLSVGMRWDLRHDIALKAQWDRSWVSRYGVGLWEVASVPANDVFIDTLSINLNCIF